MTPRGYYGIGIENNKTPSNLGTLWRSAWNLDAAFVFTIGHRYKHQSSDTGKAWKHLPFFQYESLGHFLRSLPHDAPLVGVEFPHPDAKPLSTFSHPERAVYLLGAEDHGLSKDALQACHKLVYIPSKASLNVAAAGTVLMYDRVTKVGERL